MYVQMCLYVNISCKYVLYPFIIPYDNHIYTYHVNVNSTRYFSWQGCSSRTRHLKFDSSDVTRITLFVGVNGWSNYMNWFESWRIQDTSYRSRSQLKEEKRQEGLAWDIIKFLEPRWDYCTKYFKNVIRLIYCHIPKVKGMMIQKSLI